MNLQIDEYLAIKYDWRPSTLESARKLLESWATWLDGRGFEAIGIADFEAWTRGRGLADSTRYNSLWVMKDYLKWSEIDHPLLGHKVRRRLAPPGDYLTQEDVFKLLGQCNMLEPTGAGNFSGVSIQGLRDFAVVAFLWDTWCRAQELCNVQLKHLDLKRQEVIFRVKGGTFKTAVFGPDTKAALEMWLAVRGEIARPATRTLFLSTATGNPLTYDSLRRLLRRLGKQAGIPVVAHAFRRGAARHHAEQGGSDRMGMARGRWNSPQMYVHYTGNVSLEPLKQQRWMGGTCANEPPGGLRPPEG